MKKEKKPKATAAYTEAGVDIDAKARALRAAKKTIRSTATADVISELGSFGGLHRSPGRHHVLVSSIDGVGTKLKVAAMAGVHTTIGQDLVNHCVNDVLTQGARPLFFLDYLGTSKLDPGIFRDVVHGLSKTCRENGCALIGGETAEMPGLYPDGEYDLVGTIVGQVPRADLITSKRVRVGDCLIGLKARGFHTNGYSLVRKVLFDRAGLCMDDLFPGTRRSVARVLLDVHKSYLHPVMALNKRVKIRGMAHITGGGLVDNVPRALPKHLGAEIDPKSWKPPPAFRFIAEAGKVDFEEMFRVLNMGIGMVVIVGSDCAREALRILKASGERPSAIGTVVKNGPGVRFA